MISANKLYAPMSKRRIGNVYLYYPRRFMSVLTFAEIIEAESGTTI